MSTVVKSINRRVTGRALRVLATITLAGKNSKPGCNSCTSLVKTTANLMIISYRTCVWLKTDIDHCTINSLLPPPHRDVLLYKFSQNYSGVHNYPILNVCLVQNVCKSLHNRFAPPITAAILADRRGARRTREAQAVVMELHVRSALMHTRGRAVGRRARRRVAAFRC